VHGSQVTKITGSQWAGDQHPPATARAAPTAPPERVKPDLQTLVAFLNNFARESGRTNVFKLNASSGRNLIQEINPETGEVIGEYAAAEFPALLRGLGFSGSLSGFLVNSRA
jgi:uncharacterized FlaG/YvyC family protein